MYCDFVAMTDYVLWLDDIVRQCPLTLIGYVLRIVGTDWLCFVSCDIGRL